MSNSVWQSYELTPNQVPVGLHKVKVILAERNPKVGCDIVLTDVEVALRYTEG